MGRSRILKLRLALELFGFLVDADAALVSWRRVRFASAAGHHGYYVKLRLAEAVPTETLHLTPAAAAEASARNWRTP